MLGALTPSDWASIAVAVATLVLALMTWYMARETRAMARESRDEATAVLRQVEVANEQVEVAREALRVQSRPWLTLVPFNSVFASDGTQQREGEILLVQRAGSVFGRVPVRNVGTGLALVDCPDSYALGWSSEGASLARFVNVNSESPVLPPGEVGDLIFEIPASSARWTNISIEKFTGTGRHDGEFALDVRYTDWAGTQATRALFRIARDGGAWLVHRIDYSDADTGVVISTATVWQGPEAPGV